ncbi:MAG: DegV family EDD domain-containing protein [Spirochaetota bacterium]|nr:DegV family EDD domain-containing protein [Spirochaetota bacterium]
MTITGKDLYGSLTFGFYNLRENMHTINTINVFPVADGDTGSNISHTLKSILSNTDGSGSVSDISNSFARTALIGARGNSGMIIAQFFHGFSLIANEFEELTLKTLVAATREAVAAAYRAVETPMEGTILTVMRSWADQLSRFEGSDIPISIQLRRALRAARKAEKETTNQMELLRRAGVVDAGAKAFVSILEGVDQYLLNPARVFSETNLLVHAASSTSEPVHAHENSRYRYCTEALLRIPQGRQQQVRDTVTDLGDSLVLGSYQDQMRVHLHTDEPALMFERLGLLSHIEEQKVDDMFMQQLAVTNRNSDTVIVTDSSADIPQQVVDELRIYRIPQIIQIGESSYFDRITISSPLLLNILDSNAQKVSSSMPSIGEIQRHFEFLAQHYKHIVVLSVSSKLSGTYNAYQLAAKALQDKGADISIIDTKLNASAQGLVAQEAARSVARGVKGEALSQSIRETAERTTIMVSVQSLKMMVGGGRIPKKLGSLLLKLNLKPVVGLSKEGGGAILGLRLSRTGSIAALVGRFMKVYRKQGIQAYGLSYIGDASLATSVAQIVEQKTGMKPLFVEQASPVIALHAGKGSISLSYIAK